MRPKRHRRRCLVYRVNQSFVWAVVEVMRGMQNIRVRDNGHNAFYLRYRLRP